MKDKLEAGITLRERVQVIATILNLICKRIHITLKFFHLSGCPTLAKYKMILVLIDSFNSLETINAEDCLFVNTVSSFFFLIYD